MAARIGCVASALRCLVCDISVSELRALQHIPYLGLYLALLYFHQLAQECVLVQRFQVAVVIIAE